MSVAIIADRYSSLAFRLAGVDEYTANSLEEAVQRFYEIIDKGNYRVIMVSERFFKAVNKAKIKRLGNEVYPIIAALPDFAGSTGERLQELYDSISRAVGAKLKLGE